MIDDLHDFADAPRDTADIGVFAGFFTATSQRTGRSARVLSLCSLSDTSRRRQMLDHPKQTVQRRALSIKSVDLDRLAFVDDFIFRKGCMGDEWD